MPPQQRPIAGRADDAGMTVSRPRSCVYAAGRLRASCSSCSRWHSGGLLQHEGEECGYVLSGQLELTVGDTRHELNPGDSFFFLSIPHAYRNPGKSIARVRSIRRRFRRASTLFSDYSTLDCQSTRCDTGLGPADKERHGHQHGSSQTATAEDLNVRLHEKAAPHTPGGRTRPFASPSRRCASGVRKARICGTRTASATSIITRRSRRSFSDIAILP